MDIDRKTQIRVLFQHFGRPVLCERLDISERALSNACTRGIPASWYMPMIELAKEEKLTGPIPLCVFNWRIVVQEGVHAPSV